jgi:hypothetical protein
MLSSLHIIASDLDVKRSLPWMKFLDDVKSYNTIKFLSITIICLTVAKVQMLNKLYIHYIGVK